MNESQFNRTVDEILYAVEEALDVSGADVDYETSGGVLTITCENNGSKVIISRQPALKELWVAAKSGGYHFALASEGFRCKTNGMTLGELVSQALTEQCGEAVAVELPKTL